jgi:hypothetical protein
MTNTKMTNKVALQYVLANCELPADVKEKVEKMLVQVEKKNSSKSEGKLTPTQVANEGIKAEILDFMADNPDTVYTISEMLKKIPACAELANQKVSALVRQLVLEGKVKRIEEQRHTYFQYAGE